MVLSGFFAFKELVQKPWHWASVRPDKSPYSVLSLRPAEPPGQAVQEPDNTVGGVFSVSLGLLLLEKEPSGWSTSGLRSDFELELSFSERMSLLQRWQGGMSGSL